MATQNIPRNHIPQLSRRFGGFLAASAAAGLIVAGTIVVTHSSGADSAAPSTGAGSPAAVTASPPSVVSPTIDIVVSSAGRASVYESFLRDTGVTGMQVRVVESEQAREALDREISFRLAAGENVTVVYSAAG